MSDTMLKYNQDNLEEKPMVDLAHMVLKQAKEALSYYDLVKEVFKLKGYSNGEDRLEHTTQLFTELNIDGRFAYMGQQNEWGLKQWYTIEQLESSHFNRFTDDDEETDFDFDQEEIELPDVVDGDLAVDDDFEEEEEELDEDLADDGVEDLDETDEDDDSDVD